jgi:Zn-dependent protease
VEPNLRIGSLFGIPIGVTWGWFVILGLVIVGAAIGFFPNAIPGFEPAVYWALGVFAALLFFGSLLLHELAHSLLSRFYDLPVKHITLFALGGVSQIGRDARTPLSEGLIAFVGPLMSLVLAGLFWGIGFLAEGGNIAIATVAFYLAFVNVNLGVFNLIPGFPLDGGRIVRSVLWGVTGNFSRATIWACRLGQGVGWLMVVAGVAMLFAPGLIRLGGLGFSINPLNGLLFAFIGFFLANQAGGALRQERVKAALGALKVSDLMAPTYPTIMRWTGLEQAADEMVRGEVRGAFLVMDGDRLCGLLTIDHLRAVRRERWATTSVQEAMAPLAAMGTVRPDMTLIEALEVMEQHQESVLPVLDELGNLAGVLTGEQIRQHLQLTTKLRI